MPLSPEVVAEFAVGPTCPPAGILDRLSEQLANSFLPTLGNNRRSLGTCSLRATLGTNVVSMGIWGDASGFSDDQLRTALGSVTLLVPGRTAGLLVTTPAIKQLAATAWVTTDKTLGRVTLGETIDVDLQPNQIVTTVKGTFDPPFLIVPNIDFTYEVTDRLSLRPGGSEPPLDTTTSRDLDTDGPDVLAVSLLIGLLSPILGGIVFFGADSFGESLVPDSEGVGGGLAAQWPANVLTEILPPLLPGKFTFTWLDLLVDEDGVRTLGTFDGVERQPRVSIAGPRSVAVQEALGHMEATYSADPNDLRAPLTFQWSEGTARGVTTRITFFSAAHSQLSVNVQDVDGLSAANEIAVTVTVTPLEPGQQPF